MKSVFSSLDHGNALKLITLYERSVYNQSNS